MNCCGRIEKRTGWPVNENIEEKKINPPLKKLYQSLGTEFKRNLV